MNKMSFQRILGINLIIILGFAVFCRVEDANPSQEAEGLNFVVPLAFAIFVQFFANGLLGLIVREPEIKRHFWMAALLTLLIGFGVCVAGTYSY